MNFLDPEIDDKIREALKSADGELHVMGRGMRGVHLGIAE